MDQKEGSIYLLLQPFYGLTQNYRLSIFKQIHEITFHGKGGYSFTEVYNLPIYLRNYIYREIVQYYDNESKEIEKARNGKTGDLVKTPKNTSDRQADFSISRKRSG